MADQSYNKDKKSLGTWGRKVMRVLEPQEAVAVQTRAEQKEIEFSRAMDALGVTWLVTRTSNWLTFI